MAPTERPSLALSVWHGGCGGWDGNVDWHCTETADLTDSSAAFRWSEVTVQTEWHGQIFYVNSFKGTSNIIFLNILYEVQNDSQDISRGISIYFKK